MMGEERRKIHENREGEGLAHYVHTCHPLSPILFILVCLVFFSLVNLSFKNI